MAPSDQQQGALTSLEDARALLMARLRPAEPVLMALDAAAGCICAEPLAAPAHPPQAYALRRGWAVRADEIVGASNYAPVLPAREPLAIEAGDCLPPGYDCVIEPYGLERIGAMAQVVVEAAPGANVRRPGEDAQAGQVLLAPGHRLRASDLACAALLGVAQIRVRQPHVAIVEAPGPDGAQVTGDFLARAIAAYGARVSVRRSADRSAPALEAALMGAKADLILLMGGTGSGAGDHAMAALRLCGEVHLHGVALAPGHPAVIASVAGTVVIAMPALFEQAFGLWLGLVRPALDHLTLRAPSSPLRLALTHKIASRVGLAEVALLRQEGDRFTPLAVGDLPLQSLCTATHAAIIAAGAEGHAAGELVAALALGGAE